MNKSFQDEERYLEDTLERFQEAIETTELRLKAIPRMHADNPRLMDSLLRQYGNRLNMLKRTENKPYFARINFKNKEDGVIEECYIGKVGVYDDDNNLITVDWRAPISSMYYDSNVGVASYQAPEGIIEGELLVKRQYDIEDKKLRGFQDVDTVSNDEMLKPYLGVSTDNRLKNIVSTIQSEQNDIIREKLYKNLIIQGVAGSGKTTVALHRIAYLVYNNIDIVKPEQYLVIGPNKFFVNYISGVLPDLDVNNVSQLTYDEILQDLIKEDFELISDEKKLIKSIVNPDKLFFERLRVSMVFKNAIDEFLNEFDSKVVPTTDFFIKGYRILPQKLIKQIYDDIKSNDVISYDVLATKIERACLLVGKYIEENKEEILASVRGEYSKKIDKLSQKEITKEQKNIEFIEKELRNNCNQSLKKYFKGSPKILTLYMNFLKDISKYITIDEYDITSSSKKVFTNIKNKKIEFEDLAALIYLYYRIYGSKDFVLYRHAVVDEAQDFGEFNFYVLKQLMPKCTFSIFGDLAQSIYQYRGIENWEKVIDTTFEGKCDMKYLKKSYRTTIEIMNSANNLTSHIGLTPAEPVIRHGVNVEYIDFGDDKLTTILTLITNYLEKSYESIAIISKDIEEAESINEELKSLGITAHNITDSNTEYKGGLCTITSYLAKGLEFDGVIITDASENKYSSSKTIDMKLLYVAMTRPLHELSILYNKELVKPLQKELTIRLK